MGWGVGVDLCMQLLAVRCDLFDLAIKTPHSDLSFCNSCVVDWFTVGAAAAASLECARACTHCVALGVRRR